jgi:FKBP-type peptidyl-prolyl cis-trans isomerase 2
MQFQKHDFIEIEFTGKVKDTNQIFDSNIPEELKKINPDAKAKPLIFCLGEDMFLKGVEEFLLTQSELNKDFEIELSPEKAFGLRDSKLVQVVPISVFYQQKISPHPGAVFNFDGKLGKVLSVSGGRVITDFNNLLAGKTVIYNVKVLRKVEDITEKVNSVLEFFLRKTLPFEIKDKKLIVDAEKGFAEFLMLFKDKFKEMLDLDLEIKELSLENKKEISDKIKEKVSEIKSVEEIKVENNNI